MLDYGYYNMDCMDGMKEFPDNYFDLAIVDPPYGGVTQGGYAQNKMSGGVAESKNDYVLDVWNQDAPSKEYFDELFRVSKNQIVWGGVITSSSRYNGTPSAGSYGISKSPKTCRSRTWNSRGHRLTAGQRYSASHGTG